MSDYKIRSIGKIDFRKYKDVVRVIATKKRGFWASLFSSPKEVYFILSEDSPLYGALNAAKNNKSIWAVPETSFTVERVNDRFYRVEKSIALYEKKKAKRLAETKRKADEARKAKEQQAQREREEADKKRKEEETAKRIDEAVKNATIQKMSLSDFQVSVDENASFSDQMAGIAGNVNLCFVTGNKQGVTDNLVILYNKVHKLKRAPNFINVFFKYQPDHEIERINEELEKVIDDLTNTKNKYILHDINQYPVLSTKAHTRPFERKWLNIMAAIIIPLGTVLYFRMWRFRLRMYRDLRVVKQTNDDVINRIKDIKVRK